MANKAHEYVPKRPVVAMQVVPPFIAVARWCGGTVMHRYGPGSTVIGVEAEGAYDQVVTARVGDYLAEDPLGMGYVVYGRTEFENYFERKS